MTRKVYVGTDAGPGDGGKGGFIHWAALALGAHTVIKEGGAQGNHGMSNSKGERFAFSQWGCGTLEGIPTFVSPRFVASPVGLLNEAQALRYQAGVHDPFALLTVDGRCVCTTSFHGIASRLKEMARGNNPRGTIGTGVGEAFRYAQRAPELTITAGDMSSVNLRERLAAVREQIRKDLSPITAGEFMPDDREAVAHEIALLNDDSYLDAVEGWFREVARLVRVVDADYLGRVVLKRDGTAVVERSHGVLTDEFYGFHPHTSALRTLPSFTQGMLRDAGYGGPIVNIAIHRAYTIRHGAGPMPTADPSMGETLLPGSHKATNRYQGEVRVGALDLPLLRYAINAAGGQQAFDGLAITWFDQVVTNGEWRLCNRYREGTDDRDFFTPEGELKVRHGDGEVQLRYTEGLGARLKGCVPEIEVRRIPAGATREELFELCAATLNERLGIPVRLLSLGPTETDKIIK